MRIENQTLTGEVTFDDHDFVRCTFKDCAIWYHGGRFSVVDIKFDGHIVLRFRGAAENTLAFLKILQMYDAQMVEQLIKGAGKAPSAATKSN